MPFKHSKYDRDRREKPSEFVKRSFRTVPISHVPHKKRYPKGTKAIVGKWKNEKAHKRAYGTQSVLIPKKRKR